MCEFSHGARQCRPPAKLVRPNCLAAGRAAAGGGGAEQSGQLPDRKGHARAGGRSPVSPLAPDLHGKLRGGLRLPHHIEGWHRAGLNWFDQNPFYFLAALAAKADEPREWFVPGVTAVYHQLLFRPRGRPFSGQVFPKFRGRREYRSRFHPADAGFAVLLGEIDIFTPDKVILRSFKAWLSRMRRQTGIKSARSRPASFDALKRDLVICALDGAGWDIGSIQIQLCHMGCVPFPENCDLKTFVRKVRKRIRDLVRRIIEESQDHYRRPWYQGMTGP